MTKFRKKPVVIHAIQITQENYAAIEALPECGKSVRFDPLRRSIEIDTLEGTMDGQSGDWLIRGVQGELYPCKPDIFAATYEAVEENA